MRCADKVISSCLAMVTVMAGFVALVTSVTAADSTAVDSDFTAPLGFTGCRLQGTTIVDVSARPAWSIAADKTKYFALAQDGVLTLGGQVNGEIVASCVLKNPAAGSDYVLETTFSFSRPELFYGHLFFIVPRVAESASGKGYRISYRFNGPGRFAFNNTGFFLYNTASPEFQKDPQYSPPVAGGKYRVAYDQDYTAYTVVRTVNGDATIAFYVDDPANPGSGDAPLFEYTDKTPAKILKNGDALAQVGCGTIIYPAAPVRFKDMKGYSINRFDATRRANRAAQKTVAKPAMQGPVAPLTAIAMAAKGYGRVHSRTELPNVFGDNMVLQQKKRFPVWGRGLEGDAITVSLAGREAKTTVVNGVWKVELEPLDAGGPHVLRVAGRDKVIQLTNVMVGEVWVLGGQSNMGWYLEETTEAKDEIPRSDFPNIRMFDGWHPSSDTSQFHLAGGGWKSVSPSLGGRFSAVGYYFAKELHKTLNVPIGLLNVSVPATGIESWLSDAGAPMAYAKVLKANGGKYPKAMSDPSLYFNGKVAPVMPAAVAGMIWYQADGSPADSGYRYRDYLPVLIRDWRAGFGRDDLPFLVVQLPRFKGTSPEIRESQLLTVLKTSNAGLAVTLDAGDPEDIHPRNKRPMGERLALVARALAYGEKIEYMGPIYKSMETKDGKAYLTFDHIGSGLVLKGSGGFEIRGSDGKYVPAETTLAADNRLVVWSKNIAEPVAVRYAWAPVPEISVYNREGLLASPFRTRDETPSNSP